MNKVYLLNLILILMIGFTVETKAEDLHVVTFNIRYDNPNDGINRWEARIPLVEKYLTKESPDIIGMQEVVHRQILDLQRILPDYDYVGTGRNDGKADGEYTPIFYRKDKVNLLEHSQFWLSETPEVPGSKGWDAAITRIVTWAKFEDRESGKVFYFFNTHFDHMGAEARHHSAVLLSEKIAAIAPGFPVVVTGDFNIRKGHPSLGNDLYENLINTFRDKNNLLNAAYVSKSAVDPPGPTSTGFRPDWKSREGHPIDYIFVNAHFQVDAYRVDRIVDGDVFISDHWPVVSKISFTKMN